MPCLRPLSPFRAGALALGVLAASEACAPITARTRGPSTYRAPVLVLAYPAPGVDFPADRPVVLIRFALHEADDPIDAASFRATVDGVDRTARFRVTAAEAWGPLADSGTTATGPADSAHGLAAAGPHTVAARMWSAPTGSPSAIRRTTCPTGFRCDYESLKTLRPLQGLSHEASGKTTGRAFS